MGACEAKRGAQDVVKFESEDMLDSVSSATEVYCLCYFLTSWGAAITVALIIIHHADILENTIK